MELSDIGFSCSAKVDKNDQGGEKNVRESTALTQKGTFIMGVYGRTEFVGDGGTITSHDHESGDAAGLDRFGQAAFPEQAHDQRLTVICERRFAQQDVAREEQLKVAAVNDVRQGETIRAA